MDPLNQKVCNNFTRHAQTYMESAECQAQMAHLLVAEAMRLLPTRKHLKVVDLGVGTGFVSAEVFKYAPNAEIIGVDFSQKMLELAQNAPGIHPDQFTPVCDDIFNFQIPPDTDLCISGFTFQWIAQVPALLTRIAAQLSPRALFAFSTLGADTFKTLHLACIEAGVPYPGPAFTSFDVWQKLFRDHFQLDYAKEIPFPIHFDTPFDFLRSIQKTGAVNPHHPLTVKALRTVISRFPPGHVADTYQTLILAGRIRH